MGKEQETKQVNAGTRSQTTTGGGTQAAEATNEVPKYILDAGKNALDLSWDRINQGATPYTGERVAGFNPDQNTAFQGLRDAVGTAPVLLPEALQGARTFANAPAQAIDPRYAAAPAQAIGTERLVDESGRLGAMSDYMNPYSEDVLQKTLQKIYDAADKARLNLGARATSANAYGDARHGIEGGQIDLNTQRAVGETSSQLLKEMFDTAMGWRSQDVGRFYNTDLANAGFNEQALERGFRADTADAGYNEQALERGFKADTADAAFNEQALQRLLASGTANAGYEEAALNRKRQGSADLLNFAGQDQNQLLQRLAAMLGAGQMQQGNAQATDDAKFQEFLRQQGVEEDNLKLYTNILSGIPYEKKVSSSGSNTSTQDMSGKSNETQTTTAPDNSLWQLAGTLAGAALAPATGGASLALPGIMGAAGGGGGTGLAFGNGSVGPSALPWA